MAYSKPSMSETARWCSDNFRYFRNFVCPQYAISDYVTKANHVINFLADRRQGATGHFSIEWPRNSEWGQCWESERLATQRHDESYWTQIYWSNISKHTSSLYPKHLPEFFTVPLIGHSSRNFLSYFRLPVLRRRVLKLKITAEHVFQWFESNANWMEKLDCLPDQWLFAWDRSRLISTSFQQVNWNSKCDKAHHS